MMFGWGMGYGLIGLLLMAVFWIAIIAAAVWLLARIFPGSSPTRSAGGAAETALDILKQRYARGELSKEEFEAMRHDLTG